jgi:hypothetical protein
MQAQRGVHNASSFVTFWRRSHNTGQGSVLQAREAAKNGGAFFGPSNRPYFLRLNADGAHYPSCSGMQDFHPGAPISKLLSKLNVTKAIEHAKLEKQHEVVALSRTVKKERTRRMHRYAERLARQQEAQQHRALTEQQTMPGREWHSFDAMSFEDSFVGGNIVSSTGTEIDVVEARQDRRNRLESAVEGIARSHASNQPDDSLLSSIPRDGMSLSPEVNSGTSVRPDSEHDSLLQSCFSSVACKGSSPHCMSAGYAEKPGTLYSFAKDGNRLSIGRERGSPGRPHPVDGADEPMQFVSAGGHSIAIDMKGTLWTWGRNDSAGGGGYGSPAMQNTGQLGSSRRSDIQRSVAAPLAATEQMVAADAGRYHSASISTSGRVYTWGLNDYGQLGRDARDITGAPCTSGAECHSAQIMPAAGADGQFISEKAIAIAAGRYHTVVAMQSGLVYTAGLNFCGNSQVCMLPCCCFQELTSKLLCWILEWYGLASQRHFALNACVQSSL